MTQTRVEARPLPARPRSKVAEIEERVKKALAERKTVTRDVESEYEERLTVGERVADMVAAFGGSWTFILFFAGVMIAWMLVNSVVLAGAPFDPYPYILLNLLLSTLAALQAPVIMMSQNRQASKDRARSEAQYEINLKSEIEVGQIHRLLEELRERGWKDLLDSQRRQLDYLERLVGEKGPGPGTPGRG